MTDDLAFDGLKNAVVGLDLAKGRDRTVVVVRHDGEQYLYLVDRPFTSASLPSFLFACLEDGPYCTPLPRIPRSLARFFRKHPSLRVTHFKRLIGPNRYARTRHGRLYGK